MASIELELGAPAAGGGFVARDPEGRVVFVRHGLPGERVLATITEEHSTWARADVVEVLDASPDRVDPPCPYAGPGRCGGCDYQHVTLPAQRAIKRQLLADHLRTVPGTHDVDVDVEAALPDGDGLATRTRVRFAADEAGHLAMRRHRTHELLAVEACALGVPAIVQLRLGARTWTPGAEVEAISLDGAISPTVSVTTVERGTDRRAPSHRNESVLDEAGLARGQSTTVLGEAFEVGAGVFWQVHRSAPALLVDVVLAGLELAVGDGVLDLYCGAGLFTRFAAIAVGETGSVVGVDASRAATSDARRNLAAYRWAKVVTAKVDRRSVERASDGCTHVVMDPPRRGADRGALAALCEVRSIRRLVSVSCDPSTFARDLRVLLDAGWALRSVRAFDLFEMTEHLECIAVLER